MRSNKNLKVQEQEEEERKGETGRDLVRIGRD